MSALAGRRAAVVGALRALDLRTAPPGGQAKPDDDDEFFGGRAIAAPS